MARISASRWASAPLRQIVLGRGTRTAVLVLFGAVGLVLLIACVNTAQFLLARAVERQPEVVIRAALGAGAGRLLRQFLTEALLFAAVATALGLLQASVLVGVLRALHRITVAAPRAARHQPPVILFTAMVTAHGHARLRALPGDASCAAALIAGDASRLTGTTRARTRHVMIAAQVAVSVVLLVGACWSRRASAAAGRAARLRTPTASP